MHKPEPKYNITNTLLRRAQLNPDRTALVFEELTLSYTELALRVRKQATLLLELGVCAGDRVAFIGFNQPAFLETIFAANAIGAIFVPLNFRLTAEELSFIINDAGVHTLVCDEVMQDVIHPVKDKLCCHNFLCSETPNNGWPSLAELRDKAEPLQETVNVDQHDVAVIMYTSGTTGLPKGAMLTHGNIVWNNINSQLAASASREAIVLTVAPLFHIAGINVMTLHNFALGSTLVLMRHFEPGEVLKNISKYKITHMFGAPAMFQFMAQHDSFESTDLSSIELFNSGGAAAPEALLTLYAERGIDFCQGYGLTETAPFSTFLTPDCSLTKLGSAGQPPMYTDVKIVDEQNNTLAAGERGEICISGPNIMKGYWNRPEATAEAIDSSGWFHSGDIGYFDEDGFLFICDRLKDMVISGGENVYPAEVESALDKHPAIAEVAVIGLPDDKWGEAVTAVAALHKDQQLSIEELREFGQSMLAKYKLPLRLHIVDALPRNPAGKILKFVLKEQLGKS